MADMLEPGTEVEPIDISIELVTLEIRCPTLTLHSPINVAAVTRALAAVADELKTSSHAKQNNEGGINPDLPEQGLPEKYLMRVGENRYLVESIERGMVDIAITEGSVFVRYKIILTAVGSIHAGGATYPDFVEGVKLMSAHGGFAADWVFSEKLRSELDAVEGDGSDRTPQQTTIEVDFFREGDDEILQVIKDQFPEI